MSVTELTSLIGTLCLFYLSLKPLKYVLSIVKTSLLGDSIDFKQFGEWAVVTGCTDGIGREYAKQLAAKGLNIILMSRNKEKLDNVASEIESEYKVKTKIIQVDFCGGHEIYEAVEKEFEGFEIGILVNNVGLTVPYPHYFHELPKEDVWRQLNVNCLAAIMLTRSIIPSMVERAKGAIINVSSTMAHYPLPLCGAYPSAKAFVDMFSKTLDMEYADKGIIIQSVLPGFVATKMSKIAKPTLLAPSPKTYVSSVLKKVGRSKQCFGYWPHELQAAVVDLIPGWVFHKFAMKYCLGLRDRAIRRKNAKKES